MGTRQSFVRLLKAPGQSFFLFGMRGVGKSTWSRQAFPDAHRFDLLDEGLFQSYLRDARLFGRELLGIPAGHTIVVDEVQRLPALLNDVHRFIESHRHRFVFPGDRPFRTEDGIDALPIRDVQEELEGETL